MQFFENGLPEVYLDRLLALILRSSLHLNVTLAGPPVTASTISCVTHYVLFAVGVEERRDT